MSTEPLIEPLFGAETHAFGAGQTENATVSAIKEMHEARPFDFRQKALAELARALAQNIDRGNAKGRSVGNEAAQLVVVLDKLAGVEEGVDESQIPKEVQEFSYALAQLPRIAPGPGHAEVRDSA
ncbi:hypothetical protein [Rathayibacter sp. AY1A7]|uniref:hypothetical protein n=1 Tax=Rathayibacter sp. AY1A7 TaxID=2080524 RepID=UPI000CE93946|nr:hypothetical protein [Rathayibacter sp. AY1A7]PPF21024.1 hypothetical protein C5B95_06335 [Rathayibacter sp. AY1A7]